MEMKIIWFAAIFLGGWFWFYLFGRQFIFNVAVAYPMTKKMRQANGELIAPGADRYTTVSVVVCVLVLLGVGILVPWLCRTKLYLTIGFFVGAVAALIMILPNAKPSKRSSFDLFCSAYSRFVPDDELRTAMYNRKPSQMKQRLHAMGVSTAFIPEFTN